MVEQHLRKSTPVIVGGTEEKQFAHGGMVAVAEMVGNVDREGGGMLLQIVENDLHHVV